MSNANYGNGGPLVDCLVEVESKGVLFLQVGTVEFISILRSTEQGWTCHPAELQCSWFPFISLKCLQFWKLILNPFY